MTLTDDDYDGDDGENPSGMVVSPPVCPQLGAVSSVPIWPPRTGVGTLSSFLVGDSRV